MNPKHIGELLRDTAARLEGGGLEEARLKTEHLLSDLLGCRRLELALRASDTLGIVPLREFTRRTRRLEAGEPVQYILGTTDFLGRTFKTDSRALIPRPETELLVEQALAEVARAPAAADVGTGSGCIVISLALARPEGRYLATDISAAALELARENAQALGAADRIRFVRADGLNGVPAASLDLVVSNPPYVSTAEWEQLPRDIRDREPRAALDGGADGLAVIRRLLPAARAALRPGGALLMEIGEDQAERVLSLARSAGFADPAVRKDLAGHDRIFRGIRP